MSPFFKQISEGHVSTNDRPEVTGPPEKMNGNGSPALISENPISGRKNLAFWKVIIGLNNFAVNGTHAVS